MKTFNFVVPDPVRKKKKKKKKFRKFPIFSNFK